MKLKILAIGDVTSPGGVAHLSAKLWNFRRENGVDFCIVNGENASLVYTLKQPQAEALFAAGADVITGGNHTMRWAPLHPYLDSEPNILRPLNFPADVPGHGYTVANCNGCRILVLNAMGQVHIDPILDSPFSYIDRALAREAGKYDLAVLDFHAEATGEKQAVGYAYDGKIGLIFGTHTHVPTADECILPNGTAYITDVGMCGESGGVLGMDAVGVVSRMKTHLSIPFTAAPGAPLANGVLVTFNTDTHRAENIRRVTF